MKITFAPTKEFADFQHALQTMPEQTIAALRRFVTSGAIQLTTEAQNRVPTYQGILRNSIKPTPTRNRGALVWGGAGTSVKYAPVMEYGRRPGARMPPVAPLKDWVKAKMGITKQSDIDRAAWAVAFSIARKGIEPRYFFRDALKAITPALQRDFDQTVQQIIAQAAK